MEEPHQENEPNEFAEKWRLLHDRYRRPDGEPWKGTELERATDKMVSSSYLTAMKNGGIRNPGMGYLEAIAEAMGFPFEYWRMEVEELRERLAKDPVKLSPAVEEESRDVDEDIRAAEVVEFLNSMIAHHEVMILHRPGGFSEMQRSLLRRIAAHLK